METGMKHVQFLPKDALEKLEFAKLVDWAATFAFSPEGARLIRHALPEQAFDRVTEQLRETNDALRLKREGTRFPLSAFESVKSHFQLLSVADSVLSIEQILAIRHLIEVSRDVHQFFSREKGQPYPVLQSIVQLMAYDDQPLQTLNHYLDEEGEIREEASPELQKIRSKTRSKSRESDRVFVSTLARLRKAGALAESPETMRNGRRVLAVLAEFKRQVRGIIHDESASGKTVFIEPEELIPINNDLFDLAAEERREIYKILKAICTALREVIEDIDRWEDTLVRLDVIQSKASAGMAYDGRVVPVQPQAGFKWIGARHPLLFLKNSPLKKATVPFDFDLHPPNRILVLSGPNAGGKSILMKAVGLIQCMAQSGFPVPLQEGSKMGFFSEVFADIGDQQSLEDDLSTYSSRLKNMKEFLEHSSDSALVLIDEFGTGTDPKFGGAMAESILYALNKIQVHGIITTHYSNLKQFAFHQKGIVNASMYFDTEQLEPTYELVIGKPGSSFTFEIAQKAGLPEPVLKAARKKAGTDAVSFDELLIKLQSEKQQLEIELAALREKEKQLEKLIRNYSRMAEDLQVQRKKLKIEVKTQQLQDETHRAKELERYIRELREAQNLEALKEASRANRVSRKGIEKELVQLHEDVLPEPVELSDRELEVGSAVKLRQGGQTGEVISIDKKKAEIRIGDLHMRVALKDLIPIASQIEANRSSGVNTRLMQEQAAFESKLDVRGLRHDDLMQLMEKYLDEAVLSGSDTLRIVHGKGNGVLRKAVIESIRRHPHTMTYSHPEEEQGGMGVTIVQL